MLSHDIKRYIKQYPLSLLTSLAIILLSLLPFPEIKAVQDIPLADKWTHFVMYGTLTLVIWLEYIHAHAASRGNRGQNRNDRVWQTLLIKAMLAPAVMSGILELMQEYLTTTRNGDWLDLLANCIGVGLGASAGCAALLHTKRRDRATVTAKRINTTGCISAGQVPRLLDEAGVTLQPIACANWQKAYPYCPDGRFRIAHTGDAILLHYVVHEQSVRGKYGEDGSSVWTDSCVEFFFSPCDDGTYYNLECNCIGTVLLGGGAPRPNHERASSAVTGQIDRWASLGHSTFDTRHAEERWEVSLVVPVTALFKHRITSLCGLKARANFYKCGDELPQPHFLSWSPIRASQPNFHLPEFFGTVLFEE